MLGVICEISTISISERIYNWLNLYNIKSNRSNFIYFSKYHRSEYAALYRALQCIMLSYLKQNSYPMRDWHVKHMELTLVKFVRGLSENATRWEVRLNNKYGKIGRVRKRIEYDIKHGVTNDEVFTFLQLIRTESNYHEVRSGEGSMGRMNEIQSYYEEPPKLFNNWNNSVI